MAELDTKQAELLKAIDEKVKEVDERIAKLKAWNEMRKEKDNANRD